MSKHTIEINNMAEGQPDPSDPQEPPSPLHTSAMPRISDSQVLKSPVSQTGLNPMVNIEAEGRGDDDSQDASPTQDDYQRETESNMQIGTPLDRNRPILVVEDTSELAEVIQVTLENMGLNVQVAAHGNKALEKFQQIEPQLILLDIGLPDMPGWKLLDNIKHVLEQSSNPTLPTIIVITAYGDPANRLIGKLQNIHSYLIKPFTPDEVEELVTMALNGEKPADPNLDDLPSHIS